MMLRSSVKTSGPVAVHSPVSPGSDLTLGLGNFAFELWIVRNQVQEHLLSSCSLSVFVSFGFGNSNRSLNLLFRPPLAQLKVSGLCKTNAPT